MSEFATKVGSNMPNKLYRAQVAGTARQFALTLAMISGFCVPPAWSAEKVSFSPADIVAWSGEIAARGSVWDLDFNKKFVASHLGLTFSAPPPRDWGRIKVRRRGAVHSVSALYTAGATAAGVSASWRVFAISPEHSAHAGACANGAALEVNLRGSSVHLSEAEVDGVLRAAGYKALYHSVLEDGLVLRGAGVGMMVVSLVMEQLGGEVAAVDFSQLCKG